MPKWDAVTFVKHAKDQCPAHVVNVLEDLVQFTLKEADVSGWGRGEETVGQMEGSSRRGAPVQGPCVSNENVSLRDLPRIQS